MSNSNFAPELQHAAGVASPAVAPPAGKNGLGIAAIILGAVGLLFALIPLVGAFGGFLGFVGLVLGLIGIFLKNKSKRSAVIGTALSGAALILSIVMGVVYAAAFVSAVDESLKSGGKVVEVAEGAEDAPEATTQEDLGGRGNPAPIGSMVLIEQFGQPIYEVTVAAPSWDVTADVAAANTFNPAPAAGNQYASLPVTVKYVGTDTGSPQFDLQIKFVSEAGQSYSGGFVVADGQLSDIDELYPDATGSGTVIIEIPSDGAGSGTWSVENLFGDPIFFAAQ